VGAGSYQVKFGSFSFVYYCGIRWDGLADRYGNLLHMVDWRVKMGSNSDVYLLEYNLRDKRQSSIGTLF
jgi:hypothetical protein